MLRAVHSLAVAAPLRLARAMGSKSAPEKVAIVGSGNWCVGAMHTLRGVVFVHCARCGEACRLVPLKPQAGPHHHGPCNPSCVALRTVYTQFNMRWSMPGSICACESLSRGGVYVFDLAVQPTQPTLATPHHPLHSSLANVAPLPPPPPY